MFFSLREFIKKGLLEAVGKMADYQVILNATGWYEKNVLLEEDLAEIQTAINLKNVSEYLPTEDEILIIPENEIQPEQPANKWG